LWQVKFDNILGVKPLVIVTPVEPLAISEFALKNPGKKNQLEKDVNCKTWETKYAKLNLYSLGGQIAIRLYNWFCQLKFSFVIFHFFSILL
jgi:hypothetical protein